jgi:hypothetical protein
MEFELAAQLRTSSRAANCSDVSALDDNTDTGNSSHWVRRPRFPLERVLIVPAFERQVDRHHGRTRRLCRVLGGGKLAVDMRIFFVKIALPRSSSPNVVTSTARIGF